MPAATWSPALPTSRMPWPMASRRRGHRRALMDAKRWELLFRPMQYTTRRRPRSPSASQRHHPRDHCRQRERATDFDEVYWPGRQKRRTTNAAAACAAMRRLAVAALEEGARPCRRRRSRFASMASWSTPSKGQTILEAARASGKYIPTLCYLEGLTRGGRLPPVHGRALRHRPPASRLHHAGAGRHVGHHQLAPS